MRHSDGTPTAGVRVDLLREDGRSAGQRLNTSEQGTGSFAVDPERAYRLRLRHHGAEYLGDLVRAGDPVAVDLLPASLRLTDSQSAPITGARVDLLAADQASTGQRAATDETGLARFDVLPGCVHRFRATLNGAAAVTGSAEPGTESLLRTARTELRLRAGDGSPMAGARVDLRQEDGSGTGLRSQTDAQGSAGFEVLPAAVHRLEVRHAGGILLTAPRVGGGIDELSLVPATLALVTASGAPLAGARVDLLHDNGAGAGERTATDDGGVAGFDLLPGDAHGLRVHLQGGTRAVGPLAADEGAVVSTQLSRLVLTDPSGAPVVGIRVDLLQADGSATSVRTQTDATGTAAFEVLPEQHVRFRLTANGASRVTDMVPAGELATLTLDGVANEVSLALLDSEGAPVEGVRVDLLHDDGSGTGQRPTTDAGGTAAFEVLPGQEHALRARVSGAWCLSEVRTGGGAVTLDVALPVAKLVAGGVPDQLAVLPAYPNPFSPSTTLRFVLPGPEHVSLAVYGATGQRLRLLLDGEWQAGEHQVVWDGRDDAGRPVASGTYLYRLQAGARTAAGRITYLRWRSSREPTTRPRPATACPATRR